jgi:hypothetical protein
MELTKEQMRLLDILCLDGKWELNENGEIDVDDSIWLCHHKFGGEIPFKFNKIKRNFYCHNMKLTTLKNYPKSIGGGFTIERNNLTEYFKSIKEEDFPHWDKLDWLDIIEEYPFLINICKNYVQVSRIKYILDNFPQTKLYLE